MKRQGSRRPASKARKLYLRIVVIFVLFIIIPSIILSYFSITTIQREAKAVERDRLSDAENRVRIFIRQVCENVEKAVDDLSEKTGRFFEKENTLSAEEFFAPIEKASPLMKRLLVMDASPALAEGIGEEVLYPPRKLPYLSALARGIGGSGDFLPHQLWEVGGKSWEEAGRLIEIRRNLEDRLREAKVIEIRDKNYGRALELYREIGANTDAPDLAASGKNGAARVLRKTGDVEAAAETWVKLMNEASSVRLPNDLPVALVAYQEAGASLITLGKYGEAAAVFLRFYAGLLEGSYALSKWEYEHAVVEVAERMDELAKQGRLTEAELEKYGDLKALEPKISAAAAFYEFLSGRRQAFGGGGSGTFKSLLSRTPEGTRSQKAAWGAEIIIYRQVEIGAARKVVAGFMLDREYLAGTIMPQRLADMGIKEIARVVPSGRSPQSRREEKGKRRTGRKIDESDTASPAVYFPLSTPPGDADALTSEVAFPEILLGWKVHVTIPQGARSRAQGKRIVYIYLATIIALVIVILAGILMSLRNIGREIELSRLKSDFVANVSHELKTPLTSIRMFSEMLKLGRVKNDEKRMEYYSHIAAESDRLSNLINNILDFSRIEEGKKEFSFKTVNPAKVVSRSIESFRHYAEGKKFTIKEDVSEDLPDVRADEDALSQAVINLLSNAVKYSGDNRRVEVSAFTSEGNVAIRVTDFGIGIKKEDMPHLFEKFYRAGDHLSAEAPGSGLGLTLVERIIDAHGGKVDVVSTPGKGSAFTIYLPAYNKTD